MFLLHFITMALAMVSITLATPVSTSKKSSIPRTTTSKPKSTSSPIKTTFKTTSTVKSSTETSAIRITTKRYSSTSTTKASSTSVVTKPSSASATSKASTCTCRPDIATSNSRNCFGGSDTATFEDRVEWSTGRLYGVGIHRQIRYAGFNGFAGEDIGVKPNTLPNFINFYDGSAYDESVRAMTVNYPDGPASFDLTAFFFGCASESYENDLGTNYYPDPFGAQASCTVKASCLGPSGTPIAKQTFFYSPERIEGSFSARMSLAQPVGFVGCRDVVFENDYSDDQSTNIDTISYVINCT